MKLNDINAKPLEEITEAVARVKNLSERDRDKPYNLIFNDIHIFIGKRTNPRDAINYYYKQLAMVNEKKKSVIDDIENTLKNADNEATAAPFWAIVDPAQNMSCDLHQAAGQFTGVFFSRETATVYFNQHRHRYGKNARVFCFSGQASAEYYAFCKELGKV